jgi:hypothetical protein
VATLLFVNYWITGKLFRLEYSAFMGSIEAAYISLSTQIIQQWPHFDWFPLWYGGIPFQNAYPPLLHFLVAGWAKVAGVSMALSHHMVTAATYCLGPVSLFVLARVLGAGRMPAWAAALVYSTVSFSAWLLPSVRTDVGGFWHGRRFQALLVYGEGPHVTAMTLLPLAIVALHFALRRRWIWTAPLALAAVVLSNWLGGFALAAAVFCYLVAFARDRHDWFRTVLIGVWAYALAMPWIPPTTLEAIKLNAQRIGGDFRFGWTNALGLAALLVVAVLAARWLKNPAVKFGAAFTVLMAGVTLIWEWAHFALVPQPMRYHLEMELALCLLLAGLVPARAWALLAAAVLCAYPAFTTRTWARSIIQPIEMTATSEYRVARWFDQHMPERRVMAPGSVSFWLNAFTATPQMAGGFDQGIVNQTQPGSHFQVLSGMGSGERKGPVAIGWLQMMGVDAVAVSQAGSTEVFKPFAHPTKFDGLLRELWREGGDVIYEVPRTSPSLARIVRADELPRGPIINEDLKWAEAYLHAINDPARPQPLTEWLDRSHLRVRATVAPGELVSILVTYHPGWRSPVPLEKDQLGQILLRPSAAGDQTIDLTFDGGAEMTAARLACGFALVAMLLSLRGRP